MQHINIIYIYLSQCNLIGVDLLGKHSNDMSEILIKYVGTDTKLGLGAHAYHQAIKKISVGGVSVTPRGALEEAIHSNVLKPLQSKLNFILIIRNRLI